MDSLEAFSYPALSDPTNQIRLLKIDQSSGKDGSLISVTLEAFDRNQSLSYDALSYTWGDPAITTPILVNGYSFGVTTSLHYALGKLQDFGCKEDDEDEKVEYVWIDALCINQQDDAEKSVQVQGMKSIFADATRVIVSLGNSTEEGHIGLVVMTLIVGALEEFEKEMERGVADKMASLETLMALPKEMDEYYNNKDIDLLEASDETLMKPWWGRVWVIQEVAVAKRVRVICGDDIVDFELFRRLDATLAWHAERNLGGQSSSEGWDSFLHVLRGRMFRRNGALRQWLLQDHELLEALNSLYVSGDCQATNPSDYFYSILGLRIDLGETLGTVDYSTPWQTLYTAAARTLLLRDGPKVLTFCMPFEMELGESLPSWAPDWRHIKWNVFDTWTNELGLSASGQTQANLSIDESNKYLRISGVIVDWISNVEPSCPFDPSSFGITDPSILMPAMTTWHQSVLGLVSAISDKSDEEKLGITLRSLTAGCLLDRYGNIGKISTKDLHIYASFLELLELDPSDYPDPAEQPLSLVYYLMMMVYVALRRRPFLSEGEFVGIGPETSQPGDVICILYGAAVPFVVRPLSNGYYQLLGEAYIDGLMEGQFLDVERPTETFVLC